MRNVLLCDFFITNLFLKMSVKSILKPNQLVFVSFLWRIIGSFLLHTKKAYDLMECHDFDPRSFDRFKVIGRKSAKFASSLYLPYEETLEALIHKEIAYDLKVSHYFDPWSFLQVEGHKREKSRSISFLWRNIKNFNFIQRLLMTPGRVFLNNLMFC